MFFERCTQILEAESVEALKKFVARVNAHIDALDAWERHLRETMDRERALFDTPAPLRSECDGELAFQAATRFWLQANRGGGYWSIPGPSAAPEIEQVIDVYVGPEGNRSYRYAARRSGARCVVADDTFLQSAKYEG